ncbi:hypothetical protein CEXT_163351 [Caerostris extrusa]|uniref:Uncharacterized protein n=1 Tax=Caerostris extrusa TaxID=172846 RepID=A0AAV4SWT7_CAEEX|nr:hypothetical protein CEXT_163351 [Caerostris extrusa]
MLTQKSEPLLDQSCLLKESQRMQMQNSLSLSLSLSLSVCVCSFLKWKTGTPDFGANNKEKRKGFQGSFKGGQDSGSLFFFSNCLSPNKGGRDRNSLAFG